MLIKGITLVKKRRRKIINDSPIDLEVIELTTNTPPNFESSKIDMLMERVEQIEIRMEKEDNSNRYQNIEGTIKNVCKVVDGIIKRAVMGTICG